MKIYKKNKDKYSIGDRFVLEDGTKLKCVKELFVCNGCYFVTNKIDCDNIRHFIGYCSSSDRIDKEGVIFKKIEE